MSSHFYNQHEHYISTHCYNHKKVITGPTISTNNATLVKKTIYVYSFFTGSYWFISMVYIDSLRHVSHHHIICTHYHSLVEPNVICKRPLVPDHNIVLHSRRYISCYEGLFDQKFHLNRQGLERDIWTI